MQISDEQLIQEYLDKKRSGITINKECLFMPVRITGMEKTTRIDKKATSELIREKYPDAIDGTWEELLDWAKANSKDIADLFKEHIVDRPKEEFSKLDLYNGLPIIKEHPENREMLNYTNLKDNPIIGTIVKPYLDNDEIWGIAKIYDLTLLDDLEKLQSTSPAVVSVLDYPDNISKKDDIIQEYPVHFNHLAFVTKGHWDQVSSKAYDANNIALNIDKEEKVEKTTEEKVEALEKNEKEEGEKFEALAKEHKNLDSKENPILDKEEKEVLSEKVDETEEKVDETEEKVDEAEEKVDEAEEKVGEVEEEADEAEEEVDEEDIQDEAENQLDEERAALIAHFRDAKSRAHPSLGVKMPYISKRENPSAVISKILKLNTHLFNPKFDIAIDSHFDRAKYELQIDAFNDLLGNIEIETEAAYKASGKQKSSGFTPTQNPRIQVDKNF